jgi:hypothetical protein
LEVLKALRILRSERGVAIPILPPLPLDGGGEGTEEGEEYDFAEVEVGAEEEG